MANGLITSFFTSSTSCREKESIGSVNKISCDREGSTGLTLDLCGLLHSGSSEDQTDDKKKKKKKRAHRKRGHVHLARLSEGDNCVTLEQIENEVGVCEEVTITDLEEESVVWLSPLKQKPSLSSSWQQVFNRTQKKSPIKKLMSPPQRCRSPHRPTQVKRSPLKQAVKRQLLSTPCTTNTALLPIDHAPYTDLVHVQQSYETTETASPGPLCLPLRVERQPSPDVTGDMKSLGQSVCHPTLVTVPLFEPVSDRSACLNQIQREHPHLEVSDIYSRYSSLTRKCRLDGGKSLMCSVRVKVCDTGITVDQSAYPMQPDLQDHMHSDLWSSIYRPRTSKEVIGNSAPCSKLCAWLSRWKTESSTPDCDKREAIPQHRNKHQNSNGWWMNDSDDDFMPPGQLLRPKKPTGLARRYLEDGTDAESAEEEELCPVTVLCGPPGSGKTSSVYACAQQLGFGVFEVNSSSCRGRAQMLSTLREVTLSHQVAQQKRNGLTVLEREQKVPQMVSLESNTLILLEEVDVLFEEERGFWSAVYEIIRSTKRPFVMTCSDTSLELSCPHLRLFFDCPHTVDLAVHIRLLSLAHGVSLSSAAANQIALFFKSDIRKTFHFMHAWLSWSPSNNSQLSGGCTEPSPQSCQFPSFCHLSADWRISPVHPALQAHSPSSFRQSDLFAAAARADVSATLDLLNPAEVTDMEPWWRVAPVVHLLDELPYSTFTDCASTQSDIAMEVTRLAGMKADHKQTCPPTLHNSLKTCLEAFSLNWRMARVAMVTEGLPVLRLMSILEDQRRAVWCKRRFHHYLKQVDVSSENLSLLSNTTFV